jgi:hypothetical protein
MATPVFCCGFECGVLSNVGVHWLNVGVGTPTIDTTTVRTGLRSVRFNAVAAGVIAGSATGVCAIGANAVNVARFALRFATLPNGNVVICTTGSAPTIDWGLYFQVSDGKLYCRAGGVNGATGVALATNTWYMIDLRFTIDATGLLMTVDARVDGIGLGTAALGAFVTEANYWVFGLRTAVTADMYADDFLASNTSADYPFGDGYVLSYIPNADGSHNVAGSNDFEKTLTGTDITNSTTDAWQLVDERPLPTTAVDFINGIAPPNGTDYVEIAYEDSVEPVAPRTVEAIVVYHDAGGAGTNSFGVSLRNSGGAGNVDIMTEAPRNVGATISYGRKHFATDPAGAAWTLTVFNALRSRFRVADASPDPYLDALMLEAEYAAAYTGPLIRAITVLDACHRAAFH